jgi:hypothetical protein
MTKKLDFQLTREERTNDRSGTPGGLIAQAHRTDNLLMVDRIPAEANVLVEFVVGKATREKTGYSRFVAFREKIDGKRYGVAKEPKRYDTSQVSSG